ncbi:MAG TPA: hypothetical protein VG871_04270 [Vicinamibacterales bacterium]|nr:hypothetical protein [Vicinamibacterales bacterium]
MRTINYACVALLLAAACGSEQAACPGESSDNIACTADICDQATNQWVHVPDNGACGSAQVCTLTGCADSALTGTAYLFGHDPADPAHDHSGITVTLLQAGASGSAAGSAASVTTAADGTWSIGAEPGAYTVQYTKAGYFTVTTPGVVVAGVGGGVAPTVTLSRSQRFNASTFTDYIYNLAYTPSHTAVVEMTYSPVDGDPIAYVTPLDGSHGTVTIPMPTTSPIIGDDALLWYQDNNVWSAPLDGSSQPCIVGSAITSGGATGSITIVGTPKTYVVLEKVDPATGLQSLWTAKTDCSVPPPTAAAWTESDANHPIQASDYDGFECRSSSGWLYNDEHTVLFFTQDNNNPATSIGAHRIDFASNTSADVPFTIPFHFNVISNALVSPDGEHVYGAAELLSGGSDENGNTFVDGAIRGFMADVTAESLTTPITLAPVVNANLVYETGTQVGYEEVDWALGAVAWTPDSSGVVYSECCGPDFWIVNDNLRYWKVGAASATDLASYTTYPGNQSCFDLSFFGNGVVGYPSTQSGSNYSITALDGTATTQVIDSSGLSTIIDPTTGATTGPASYVDPATGAAYLVWAEPTTAGGSTPNIIKSAAVTPSPLSATVTTLGSAIASTCSFSGALSTDYFYELCANTGTITAFPPSSATASGQFTGALAPLYAVPGANAIAFEQQDGRIWGASNGSTFGSDAVYLVASTVDSEAINGMAFLDKWLVYYDPGQQITRVSNVSAGGVIDEPLSSCNPTTDTMPTMDNAGSNLWFPAAECITNGDADYRTYMAPTANLP